MPVDQISVRPMQASHIDYVISLLANGEVKAALHCGDTRRRTWVCAFRKNLRDPDERDFVLYRGDTPAGWLKLNGLKGDMAWISMLVIEPRFQRQGIGSFAVRWSEGYVKSLGFRVLRIHTTADNLPAQACYEKLGYLRTEEGGCTNGDGLHRLGYTYEKQLTP